MLLSQSALLVPNELKLYDVSAPTAAVQLGRSTKNSQSISKSANTSGGHSHQPVNTVMRSQLVSSLRGVCNSDPLSHSHLCRAIASLVSRPTHAMLLCVQSCGKACQRVRGDGQALCSCSCRCQRFVLKLVETTQTIVENILAVQVNHRRRPLSGQRLHATLTSRWSHSIQT